MTVKQLIEYINAPELLNADSLGELAKLCEQYPYFQQVQALYLKNLKILDDIEYDVSLKKAALQAPDRDVLHKLLERRTPTNTEAEKPEPVKAEQQPTTAVEDKADIKQAEATTAPKQPAEDKAKTNNATIRAIETEYKLDETDISSENKLKHQDLIDKFIESNPHISPVKKDHKSHDNPGSLDISYTEEDVTDSIFSEGLARIYIRQKEYAKAIRIFEKLNLKYPEKSAYFADQIRFLKKVINNT